MRKTLEKKITGYKEAGAKAQSILAELHLALRGLMDENTALRDELFRLQAELDVHKETVKKPQQRSKPTPKKKVARKSVKKRPRTRRKVNKG